MVAGMREVVAVRLSPEAFAPFGWLPVSDTDPIDAALPFEFAWNDAHVNVISHAPDEVEHSERGLVCDRFYRHDTHTQTLLALDTHSVVAVAPAAATFASPTDLGEVRAFVVAPLEGFALARGTWHWGPFPLGDAPVRLWNVQGKRYREDNVCVELDPALDITFETSR